ncbi:MAG TPA: hypothetical protein VIX63_03810 [Vicinamibacterales bacterium]
MRLVAVRRCTRRTIPPVRGGRTGRSGSPVDGLVRETLVAVELLFTPALVPRFLGVLERLAGIAMLSTRPPVAAAVLAAHFLRRRSFTIALLFAMAIASTTSLAARVSIVAILTPGRPRCFRRVPQLPARKPLHLGVGMLLFQPLKRGHELFALRGAERGRQAVGDDGPVRITRWH